MMNGVPLKNVESSINFGIRNSIIHIYIYIYIYEIFYLIAVYKPGAANTVYSS